jgi:hypothetical protein
LWFFTALSMVGGFAAASLSSGAPSVSSQVHSGSPGYKQSPSGRVLHWEKKALTVYLDHSLDELGPGAREAVMQAFGQWVGSDPRLPDLSFDTGKTSVAPRQDGKSTVSFGRITAPGHEHDVAITVSYSNDKTGEIIEADIILNSLYPMGVLTAKAKGDASTSGDSDRHHERSHDHDPGRDQSVDCKNRYDAQNVATHEAGHFFGLGEDPTEHRATMFQTIDQCETHKRVLAVTDIGAMTTLYAQMAAPDEVKTGARACSLGGAPADVGGLELSTGIFALSLLRRRRRC